MKPPTDEPHLDRIRRTRQLPDKILMAFHMACDQGDLEIAELLVKLTETMLTRRPAKIDYTARRHHNEALVAAYERLWGLRHVSLVE